jgi:hypothetical protein
VTDSTKLEWLVQTTPGNSLADIATNNSTQHCAVMHPPIDTSGYDHVVVIDSQVVLETKPLVQLPWQELFPGTALLLVTRQAQSEIDAKKSDSRLGKRAREFNRLLDGFIETRVPSRLIKEPRIDVATVANRSIDWSLLDDLDRDDGDDRIVAQMINARVDDPARLMIFSHDMRPRDAARSHGHGALKLPESWLREPEPSPHERRIVELEAQNRLLSVNQPELRVKLEVVTPSPWKYRVIEEIESEAAEAFIMRAFRKAPRQDRGDGLMGMSSMSIDHSFESNLKRWKAEMRQDIPLMHAGLSRYFSQHRIRARVENVGSISAEGLSLELRSGNLILHAIPYDVLVVGRSPPYPSPLRDILRPSFTMPQIPRPRDQFDFYWDEVGPGDHLIETCISFRQGKSHEVEVSVELLPGTAPKAQIEAVLTATNMKGEVRSRLLVDTAVLSQTLDEVFDVDTGKLRVNPPFDLPDDASSRNVVWFRNNGEEYSG